MDFLTHYLTHILPYDRKPRGEVKTPLKQGSTLPNESLCSATLHYRLYCFDLNKPNSVIVF